MEQYYKKPTQWKPRKETQSSGVVVSARITGQTCGMRQRPDEDEQRERDGGGEAAQEQCGRHGRGYFREETEPLG